jgi:signal transduction histidine kinase
MNVGGTTSSPVAELASLGIRLPVGGSALELSFSVLDAAPVGMALADASGGLHWVNVAMCQVVRRSRADLLESGLTMMVDGADLAAITSRVGGLVAAPEDRVDLEQQWHRGDGTTVWVSVSTSAAVDPAGHVLTVGTPPVPVLIQQVIEIEARRRAEMLAVAATTELQRRNVELERSNADLTEFAYVVSHDLSEPLRVISGHVQLLADRYKGQLDDQADRWIAFAVDGAARQRALIDSLLQYSRAGRREQILKDVDTRKIVRASLAGLQAAVDDAHGVVTVGELPTVVADATDLGRVFSNLIANAMKFHRPEVTPKVEISAARGSDEWVFSVADNGIGIPERHRERAFRLFQRLNPRGAYDGTGLGLAICRKVVTRYGGTLSISDSAMGGTTLSFTLPDQGPIL